MLRHHTDLDIMMQKIYRSVAAYFQDDDADELTTDPVFNAILNKKGLASQPTMSRFINRCDDICLMQFEQIQQELRRKVYSIRRPERILIDIDLTLFSTFGKQEGNNYNQHYNDYGYHSLLSYDGLTGDLLKAELRPGNVYTKVEKPYGKLTHLYTFIVTNMECIAEDVIRFYCKRGTMENFIKESKLGFHMDAMSSSGMMVNANKLQISVLTYNLFNWFRRLVLPVTMRKLQIDTLRLKLIKIAVRVVRSARYITFKLCSSCPYRTEFYEVMKNITQLQVKLE